jgi:DNA-directed RNA polymerase specialized sigma24 family protein
LRYYEGLSDEEIAEYLGCKPTTAGPDLARHPALIRSDISPAARSPRPG